MIGFIVLQRLSMISVSRCFSFLGVSVIGVLWTISLCERGRLGIWPRSYCRTQTPGRLIDSPPTPSSPPLPFSPLSIYPSIPIPRSSRMPMSPLPTDSPPATVSQGSLRPSPALLGRRFLPRPRGTRRILLQPRQERENELLLDMSEIKSV